MEYLKKSKLILLFSICVILISFIRLKQKDNSLYNLDDTSLVMVQKEELKEFLSGSNLEKFKEETGTISICNKTENRMWEVLKKREL